MGWSRDSFHLYIAHDFPIVCEARMLTAFRSGRWLSPMKSGSAAFMVATSGLLHLAANS